MLGAAAWKTAAKTEAREQRTEDRGQRSEVRRGAWSVELGLARRSNRVVAFELAKAFGVRRRAVSPALSCGEGAWVPHESCNKILADGHEPARMPALPGGLYLHCNLNIESPTLS
jgi:hypothetical protein